MRKAIAFAIVLIALNASAGTISSVNPSSILTRSGEYFITANGTGFTGGDQFVISGNAGTFTLNVNAIDASGALTGWIPLEVVNTPGTYSLTVLTNGVASNAVNFTIYKPFRQIFKIHLPEILTAISKGRDGTTLYYEVSFSGGSSPDPKIDCSPLSGSNFPFGRSRITCIGDDGVDRDTTFADVNVVDATLPQLVVPGSYKMPADSQEGAYLKYEVSASDDIDGLLKPVCLPESGSFVRPGKTVVNCEAVDSSFNSSYGSFEVLVVPDDIGRLELRTPEYLQVLAQSKEGAIVDFEKDVVAFGSADPDPIVQCTPPSGEHFPMGESKVYCTAVDDFDQRVDGSFIINVTDQYGLQMKDVAAEASGPDGAEVVYDLEAEDWTEAIQCTPEPGSRFAMGVTEVECSSTAPDGREAKGRFEVKVADTIPPHINRTAARTGVIDVAAGTIPLLVEVDVIDAADAMPRCSVIDLTADDPDGLDWRPKTDLELEVRSATPRGLRIQVSCADAAGNRSTATVPVSIVGTGTRRNAKVQ